MAKQAYIKSGVFFLTCINSSINWSERENEAAKFVVNRWRPELDLGYILAQALGAELVSCEAVA